MKNPKISVIIPVYNTQDYLEECLSSLVSQTYKNLEIICVNDGSTDKSPLILQQYAKQDDRIKVITQENQGFTSARNTALKEVSGDWIAFLDSDDWLSVDCYQRFIDVIYNLTEIPDIYMFNAVCFTQNQDNPNEIEMYEFFSKDLWKGKNNELCKFEDCKNPFQGNLAVYNKIYRKDFFFDNNLKFNKGFVEDERFWIEALVKAKSVYITDDVYYHYRQRKDSVMHTIGKNVFEMFETYNAIREILVENKVFNMAKYAFLQYKFNQYAWGYFVTSDEYRDDFYRLAKEDLSNELKGGYSPEIVQNLANCQLLFAFFKLTSKEFYDKFKTALVQ